MCIQNKVGIGKIKYPSRTSLGVPALMQLCKKRDRTTRTFRKLSTKCAYMNGNYIGIGGEKKNSPFIRTY